jgi:hypothetical protein
VWFYRDYSTIPVIIEQAYYVADIREATLLQLLLLQLLWQGSLFLLLPGMLQDLFYDGHGPDIKNNTAIATSKEPPKDDAP